MARTNTDKQSKNVAYITIGKTNVLFDWFGAASRSMSADTVKTNTSKDSDSVTQSIASSIKDEYSATVELIGNNRDERFSLIKNAFRNKTVCKLISIEVFSAVVISSISQEVVQGGSIKFDLTFTITAPETQKAEIKQSKKPVTKGKKTYVKTQATTTHKNGERVTAHTVSKADTTFELVVPQDKFEDLPYNFSLDIVDVDGVKKTWHFYLDFNTSSNQFFLTLFDSNNTQLTNPEPLQDNHLLFDKYFKRYGYPYSTFLVEESQRGQKWVGYGMSGKVYNYNECKIKVTEYKQVTG